MVCYPKIINHFLVYKKKTPQYNTRNKQYSRVNKHTTALFNNSIFNKAISNWLKVPAAVKKSNSIKQFVKTMTQNIINDY